MIQYYLKTINYIIIIYNIFSSDSLLISYIMHNVNKCPHNPNKAANLIISSIL